MKLPLLLTLVLLSVPGIRALAQAKAASDNKPTLSLAIIENPSGSILLQSAPLPAVVAALADVVPHLKGPTGEPGVMPNIIWGLDTQSMRMPAELRVRDVTPVQALSLVAVASGCTLEPIYAPIEPGNAEGGAIIGYEFRSAATGTMVLNGPVDPFAPRATRTAAAPLPQAMPNPLLNTATFTADKPAPNATLKVADDATTTSTRNEPPSNVRAYTGYTVLNTKEAPLNAPIVRVYAMGPFMRGSSGDEIKEKQVSLQMLVLEAMEHAELKGERPVLSFHDATKALIVKGTTAQHEIIDQIISAMKENEQSAPAASGR